MTDSLCDRAKKENIAMAGLYCDFSSLQEQTINNIMGVILKQLTGRGSISDSLREAFQEGKLEFDHRRLRLADLMGMFRAAIASLPQVFIYVDTLDECLPKCLPELLESLRGIVLLLARGYCSPGKPRSVEIFNDISPQGGLGRRG